MTEILSHSRYLSLGQVRSWLIQILQVLGISLLWILSHPYFSSFENFSLSVFFQMASLIWLGSLLVEKRPIKSAFYWGCVSFIVYLFFLRWVGESPYLAPWGILGQFLAALFLAGALFVWAYISCIFFNFKKISSLAAVSILWGLIEWSRQFWFCGFPWYGLSIAWIDFFLGPDLLGILGPFLTSSCVLFLSLTLAKKGFSKAFFLSIALAVSLVGVSRGLNQTYKLPIEVAALHTNMPLHYFPGSYDRLDVWGRFLENRPIWMAGSWNYPRFCLTHEGLFPGGIGQENHSLSTPKLASKVAQLWKCHLIVGLEDDGLETGVANAIGIWNTQGMLEGYYHKKILVPFAEYFPFLDYPWVGQWFAEISREYGILEPIQPGVLSGRYQLLGVETLFSICFEETFPSSVAKEAREGARLWMSSSNDGWFPQTVLPYDHFIHARLISSSTGLPLVRSTQGGYTCFMNGRGQICGELFSPQHHWAWRVEKDLEGRFTFYGQMNENITLFLCLGFVFGVWICSLRRKAKQS